jgi:hypothetical protein
MNFSFDRNNRNKGLNMKPASLPTRLVQANPKLLVIRINRLLGWALLALPPVQIMLGTSFWRGLAWDLALLLVHGLISLALFGTPRASSFRAQHSVRRFLGGSRDALRGRDVFLLDAWRVLMSLLSPVPLALFAYLLAVLSMLLPILGLLAVPLFCAFLFFQLLFVASVLRRVRDATAYAYRRWHLPEREAAMLGWLTMGCFVILSFTNLIKGML